MVATRSFSLSSLTLLSFSCFTFVSAGSVQKGGLQVPDDVAHYRDVTKDIFATSYNAYRKYAWGHDDLRPVSQSYVDGRNGWGATIVDALSTMQIMGLESELAEGIEFASRIDFTKAVGPVSVFETTIRYLGGMLSVYELTGKTSSGLLKKCRELGDQLSHAWVGTNAIPYRRLNFRSSPPTPTRENSNIAEAGTLTLEMFKLSEFTGDERYTKLAEKAMRHIIQNSAPLPGLPAQGLSPTSGRPVGGYVTWGGGSDSYFEYLIKFPRLTNAEDMVYANAWAEAVDSSIRTLFKRSTIGNYAYLADYDDRQRIRHVSTHLACFHGGNWLLGGKLINNDTIVQYGLELVEGCWNTYSSTLTGIGPERFAFKGSDGDFTGSAPPSAAQEAFYAEHGFYVTGSDYYLRPEVLESNFYAWRVTGDEKYLRRAADATDSFVAYLGLGCQGPCSVGGSQPTSYAGIGDVNALDSAKIDDMESFWFAEVLKYLYLTFDDPDHISLDDYVFNTEAHPFKAPPAKAGY